MISQLQHIEIVLSNEARFSVANHFAGLMRSGALKLFEMEDGCDKQLVSARAVLPDGQKYSFRILTNGERMDITLLRANGASGFDVELFRRFIIAVDPLWAGLNGEGLTDIAPICSSGAHLFTIPRFPQFSYWSRRYDTLFSGRLQVLDRFDFCCVRELLNGFWIEILCDGLVDLGQKRRIVQRFLLSEDFWEDGTNVSSAVQLALLNRQSLDDALAGMEKWRKGHKTIAAESMAKILAAARHEVSRYGKRRRSHDVCIVQSREGVEGIGVIWHENSYDGALRWVKEQMASGLVRWMAILHDFNGGTYEITVFDSLMEEVTSVREPLKVRKQAQC